MKVEIETRATLVPGDIVQFPPDSAALGSCLMIVVFVRQHYDQERVFGYTMSVVPPTVRDPERIYVEVLAKEVRRVGHCCWFINDEILAREATEAFEGLETLGPTVPPQEGGSN